MPRRRKAFASPRTPRRPHLPETPPKTPPQTPVVSRIPSVRSQSEAKPPVSFWIRVLKAVLEKTQVRPSSNFVSTRSFRSLRSVALFVLHHCRSTCYTCCWILFYPHIVIATLKRHPGLRGSIIGSHGLILIILITFVVEYSKVIRVCYGVLLTVRKLGEPCYATPQGVRYLAEVGQQWKSLYLNLNTIVGLSSAALRQTGYFSDKIVQFADFQWARLINHLNEPTPLWLIP